MQGMCKARSMPNLTREREHGRLLATEACGEVCPRCQLEFFSASCLTNFWSPITEALYARTLLSVHFPFPCT